MPARREGATDNVWGFTRVVEERLQTSQIEKGAQFPTHSYNEHLQYDCTKLVSSRRSRDIHIHMLNQETSGLEAIELAAFAAMVRMSKP